LTRGDVLEVFKDIGNERESTHYGDGILELVGFKAREKMGEA
jgi:hypothetical protein